jgi:hypothetical protein
LDGLPIGRKVLPLERQGNHAWALVVHIDEVSGVANNASAIGLSFAGTAVGHGADTHSGFRNALGLT